MSSQKISELAQNLLDRAIAEETNEDIYVAGLRETQTFDALVDIVNYYADFYREPNYFFRLLIQAMHKRKDKALHAEVMQMLGEKK